METTLPPRVAVRDKYPVTEGHTLVIPRREVPTWFAPGAPLVTERPVRILTVALAELEEAAEWCGARDPVAVEHSSRKPGYWRDRLP